MAVWLPHLFLVISLVLILAIQTVFQNITCKKDVGHF